MEAASAFTRLSNLQIQIAQVQPIASPDILQMLTQAIASYQARVFAWERSIEEVKTEWHFYD
jgi:hypothetical protein